MTTGTTSTTLHIVAAVIVRADGRALLVRKHGTTSFMQVGGKIEPGENPVAALVRECEEEIGLVVDPDAARPLGRRAAVAANEADHVVDAHVFAVDLPAGFDVRVQAELAEHVWVDPARPEAPRALDPHAGGPHSIAPLSRDLLAEVVATAPRGDVAGPVGG